MLILGIESSCDETGVALYDTQHGLLAHALHSQVEMHAEYGGVVPELASRDHIKRVLPLLTHTFHLLGLPKLDHSLERLTSFPPLQFQPLLRRDSYQALLTNSGYKCRRRHLQP